MATTRDTEEKELHSALVGLGLALRARPSVRDEVMRRVTRHAATNLSPRAAHPSGRRLFARLAAVAACALVALLFWSVWGRGRGAGAGAGMAFASAIADVERAHTFSCRQVITSVGEDGQAQVWETTFMFKEPRLERIESRGDLMPTVTVTDYGKQIRLHVNERDKVASLQDLSTTYTADEQTGRLKPTELRTPARDDVVRISARAVKDLGRDQLDGREVWVLRSDDGAEPVTTLYVDPADGKPLQVEVARPSEHQTFVYEDIRIDEPLDDALFSLDPPPGYAMQGGHEGPVKPVDHVNGKMMAKMMALLRECQSYMNEHQNQWPASLDDLRAASPDANKLGTLLSAPDSRDGTPVIEYRRPKDGDSDPAIVVYEAPKFRRKEGVVCGFTDGHAEMLTPEQFETMMKSK